jgi:transglutaminase-like putative cysteine protease
MRSHDRLVHLFPRIIVLAVSVFCVASTGLGGTEKAGGADKAFTDPAFWARAESLYGDYGGAYWLKEKKTKIEYEGGNWITTESYHRQIVVVDAAKMQDYADVSLAFGPSSRIGELKAHTITSDGSVFETKKDQVFEKSLVPGFMLYSDRKAKVFAMTGFCDHCVLDVSYVIRDEGPYLTDEFEFAGALPVRLSRYSYALAPAVIRAGLGVFYKCYNLVAAPKEEAYETPNGTIIQWTWQVEDMEAFPSEDWMPPRETIVPRILLGTGERGQKEADWDAFAKWYRRVISKADVPCSEVRDLAQSVAIPAQSEREKVQSIANKVGADTRYVSVVLSDGGWMPHEPRSVIQNKYGDCKDMALLTIAMLRELGIKAYPALLRTKMGGEVDRDLLVPRFDHMIVRVEGSDTTYWVDPTAGPCPLGYLPYADRGVDAFVITDKGSSWIRTPDVVPFPTRRAMTTMIMLSAEGNIMGNSRLRYEGDFAMRTMRSLGEKTKDDTQREVEGEFRRYLSGVVLEGCEVVATKASPPAVVLLALYQKPSAAVRIEDKMALKLDFVSPPTLDLADIGATAQRKCPIWFPYPWTECDTICVDVPTGWEVERLPVGSEQRGEYGYSQTSYARAANQVIVMRRYERGAGLVLPHEFEGFLEFWRQARDAATKDIVFRKP